MKKGKLQDFITYIIFIGKLLVILCLCFWRADNGYSTSQFIDTIAMIAPLFAAHLTVILRYYMDLNEQAVARADDYKVVIRKPMAIISLSVATAYVLFLLILINLKAIYWGSSSISEDTYNKTFKVLLGLGETLFGVYLGHIIVSIFKVNRGQ